MTATATARLYRIRTQVYRNGSLDPEEDWMAMCACCKGWFLCAEAYDGRLFCPFCNDNPSPQPVPATERWIE